MKLHRTMRFVLILVGSLSVPLAASVVTLTEPASAATTSCITWSTIATNPGSWTARPSATGQIDYNACQDLAWGREYTLCYFGGGYNTHYGPSITYTGDTSKSLCDYPDILAGWGGEY